MRDRLPTAEELALAVHLLGPFVEALSRDLRGEKVTPDLLHRLERDVGRRLYDLIRDGSLPDLYWPRLVARVLPSRAVVLDWEISPRSEEISRS